jgi:signal transduction histidine kinase
VTFVAAAGSAEARPAEVPLPDASPISLGPYFERFIDRDASLSFDEIRSTVVDAKFERNRDDVPNLGYSSAALWLRFRLPSDASRRGELLLEIQFPSLDRIEFYAPRPDEKHGIGYQRMVVGDTLPWRAREVPERNYVFRLQSSGQQDFYLRVTNEGPVIVPAYLWRSEQLAAHNRVSQLGFGVFYGLVLALILYNLMLYVSVRDGAYLYYVCYGASFGMWLLNLDGFVFEYLGPAGGWWPNNGLAMFIALSLVFSAHFTRRFLETPRIAPWPDRMLQGVEGVAGALAVCAATGWLAYRSTARLNTALGLTMAILVVTVAFRAMLAGDRIARIFLLAWMALLAGLVVFPLRNVGVAPYNLFTAYSLHIGFALDLLLLSFALGYRINVVKREAEMAKAEARTIAERQEVMRQHTLLEERQRILADMHDGLGASLIGLLRYAQAGKPDARELERRVSEALQELRIAIDALEPAEGDLAGVLGKLRYRLEPLFTSAGVHLAWDVGELPAIEALEPTAVFAIQRILLEAVSNAIQHAAPGQIRITAHARGGQSISITVEDDGRGFDPAQPFTGRGLTNMHRRAEQIGASVKISSRPGSGSTVALLVPQQLAPKTLMANPAVAASSHA